MSRDSTHLSFKYFYCLYLYTILIYRNETGIPVGFVLTCHAEAAYQPKCQVVNQALRRDGRRKKSVAVVSHCSLVLSIVIFCCSVRGSETHLLRRLRYII